LRACWTADAIHQRKEQRGTVGKARGSRAARGVKGYGIGPVRVGCAGVNIGRGARDRPSLVAGAVGLALDDDLFADAQKAKKNINVDIIVSKVADIDLRGAGLDGVVPEKVAVIWVAGSGKSIGKIKKQIG
jgi:hypothetical protein